MTDKKDEALKLALEALDDARQGGIGKGLIREAITAIREALAEQPAQHDVDWEKLYRLEVKKKEALAAKYERDTGKKLTHIVPMAEQPAQQQEPQPPYEFERYVAGSLRAQGVRVERATTLADAMRIAAKICPPANPPSAPTVLVYTSPPASKPLVGLTDEQMAVLNFMLGANELDGVWFGERHPKENGAFWWRNRLRNAFQDAAIEAKLKEKNA